MRLSDCHNFHDFRRLARRRLPSPIFNYIDGAADDEVTLRQNTDSNITTRLAVTGVVEPILRWSLAISLCVTSIARFVANSGKM